MKGRLVLVALALLLEAVAMPSHGAGAISGGESSGSTCEDYYHQGVLAVAGLDAGDLEVWSKIPGCGKAHSATQVLTWAGRSQGPIATGTTVISITWVFSGVSGCTITTPNVVTDAGAAATGSGATATITMTSTECHAIMTATYTFMVLSTAIWQARMPFAIDIMVEQPNYSFLCAATQKTANAYAPGTDTCRDPEINNLDYLCAATAAVPTSFNEAATTCNAPTVNTVVSGTSHLVIDSWPSLTASVTLAGGVTVSGTLDNLNRLCAASATGSACTTPTVNLAGAVTVHNDGTLTVTNTGGQTMTLAGAATIHADGSLTVTNAGGQALSFTGPLTVHQDPICTASSHCFQDISGLTINQTMGNVSVVVPSETTTHLCGPVTNTSACSPVVAASTISSVEAAHWLPIVAILAVLLAGIFWANPLLITLGIIGFPVYFATISPVKELGWLAMIMLSILAPAIARFYANYKARMERGAPI